MRCLATGTKRSLVTVDNMVSFRYVLLSLCDTDGAFITPLCQTFLYTSLFSCVVSQHLGNVFNCPKVNEASHHLAAG